MDRKTFIKTSVGGAVALAAASTGLLSCTSKSAPKNTTPLNLSFQEGLTPGESLQEKLDFMESLGVTGLEPGGRNLASRVEEFRSALSGRKVKISAICAGFQGFILAEDPAQKALFDSTMREIVRAAGELESTGVIMVPAFNGQVPCLPHTRQTRDFLCEELRKLGDFALECGTTVILEPLNRGEAFFLRQVADAASIARDSGSKGVRCMGDFWHMQEETSDYGALMSGGEWLQHMHIASRGRRITPGEDGEKDNYVAGFRALKELAYPHFVGFECGCEGERKATLTAAVELLRSQWEQA